MSPVKRTTVKTLINNMNLYQYIQSNPVNHVDPTGMLVDMIFNRATGELTVRDRDSGQELTLGKACAFTGKAFGMNYDPIPVGRYEILERKNRENDAKHTGWYRLDPFDSKPRNDTKDDVGEGQGRKEFRLHPGTRSTGCITVKDDCRKQYDEMRKLIDSTKTENTTDERWKGNILKFGNLIVIDEPTPTTQP